MLNYCLYYYSILIVFLLSCCFFFFFFIFILFLCFLFFFSFFVVLFCYYCPCSSSSCPFFCFPFSQFLFFGGFCSGGFIFYLLLFCCCFSPKLRTNGEGPKPREKEWFRAEMPEQWQLRNCTTSQKHYQNRGFAILFAHYSFGIGFLGDRIFWDFFLGLCSPKCAPTVTGRNH